MTRLRSNALAAYRTVAVHGGVAAADRHGLVLLLIDGALERVARARVAIVERNFTEKARAINRILEILDELRGSLDFDTGGEVAHNLERLYEYCSRLLLKASAALKIEPLDEASRLLIHVRTSWVAAQAEARR